MIRTASKRGSFILPKRYDFSPVSKENLYPLHILPMKIVPITLFFLPFVQGTNAAANEQQQQQQHLRGLGEGGGSGDGGGDDPCGFKGTWLGEGICSINFLNREEIGHGCGRNRKLKLYPNDDGTLEAFSQWKATSDRGGNDKDEKTVFSDKEPLIGFINEDECTFSLVEMDESGTMSGKTLKQGKKIYVTLLQPGMQPVAWSGIFKKKEEDE